MQITLELEDDIAGALEKKAQETGKTFTEILNETLRNGLNPREQLEVTGVKMGKVADGLDLDKALGLADELEDLEIMAKMKA